MPQLGAALAYMEAHYLEPLEVGRLASISGLSTRQFQRLFRELRGTTPLGYITRLRLERGKALLRRSGLNVTEVALRTGFSDGNYFSRVFRARLGLSPSDYRSQTKR
jgi:transcriptional regulator GlxA family with amidase domain